MNLDNYTNKSKKNKIKKSPTQKAKINPFYIVFPIVLGVVVVFLLVLLIGVKSNNKKEEEAKASPTTQASSEDTTEDVSKEELSSYEQTLYEVFETAYGYKISGTIDASDGNAYFLSSVGQSYMNNTELYISGDLIEKGLEFFVENGDIYKLELTDNYSFFNAEFRNSMEVGDENKFMNYIEFPDRMSGRELLFALEEALASSPYTEDGENMDGGITVTYPKGAFDLDTEYSYLNSIFNEYPSELKLSISVTDNGENGRMVLITGVGDVNFSIRFDEKMTIDKTNNTLVSAFDAQRLTNDEFKVGTDPYKNFTMEDYLERYGE